MKEQDIQKKIITYLESIGAYVVKVITANKSGVPDILACLDGNFIAIEVKTPESRSNLSALQAYNLNKVSECGGLALTAWNLEMVKEFIAAELGDEYNID